MRSRGARIALQLVVTVAVTWFIVRAIGIDLAALGDFDPGRWAWRPLPLAASVLVLLAGYATSGLLWRRMVVEMGGPRIGVLDAVGVYMVANLGRYVPGKVLQIAGLAVLARRRGVPASTATAAAVLGQAFALAGAGLLGLGAFFGPDGRWRIWGWVGLGVMTVLILLSSIPGPAARMRALWFRLSMRSARGTSDGSDASDPRAADVEADEAPGRVGEWSFGLRWTGLYLLNWTLYGAAFWLLFLAMEDGATFLQIAPLFAAAYLLGYVAVFAPAGGGVREGALVAFLLPIVADPGAALAFAILARIWITLVEIVPAGAMAGPVLASGGTGGATGGGDEPEAKVEVR